MNLVWTHSALGDLEHARDYVAQEDPSAAARLARRVIEVAALLRETPAIGRRGRVPGTREMAVTRTPYVLVYRLGEDAVEILRVLHGRRAWPP